MEVLDGILGQKLNEFSNYIIFGKKLSLENSLLSLSIGNT